MVTQLAEVQAQVQQFWAPLFMEELRASLLLGSLVNKDYEGQIKNKGDKVRVSMVKKPSGQTRTIGTDADSFDTALLETEYVDVSANKRFVAGFDLVDLVQIQSQIGDQNSKIREALMYSVQEQINDYLYSLVAPSSSPAHAITGVTTFAKAQVLQARTLAAGSKWAKAANKYILSSPNHYADLLNETTFTSSDYVGPNEPLTVGGQMAMRRFGFNIFEDDSRSGDTSLAFHPDFLLWVMQTQPTFQLSSKHSQKQFGYVLSVDLIGGAALGIEGDVKHISFNG
jgi:hypothetical protein